MMAERVGQPSLAQPVRLVRDRRNLDGTVRDGHSRDPVSPYSLPALIDALGEVTSQLSHAERQALDSIPPGPPACEPASSNPAASF
jgi:hypothetical protein